MGVLLLVHLVTGLVAIVAGARLGRRALLLAVLGPVLTLIWLATELRAVIDGAVVTESVAWVARLGLTIDLRLDGFAAVMVLLVSGVGVLVFAYSNRYFPRRGEGLGRLIGLLTLFSGSMLGLVLADNLLVLFVFWELTSITSYLLIGNDHTKPRARAAALQALMTTAGAGLVMFAGFVVIGQAAGTYRMSEILAAPPTGTAIDVALVLVLVGAFAKSAQYPFHSWLPGAMIAPTPVSAYLHSATMVTAGVYLVARFAPAFSDVGLWRPVVLTVGLGTMIVAGLRTLRQHDLKLLLAFGTISQLGFLMVAFGAGIVAGDVAGASLILAHGVFKAGLFMVVGIVDHETGTRDLRRLARFPRGWRWVKVAAVVCAASMAGVPLTMGFIAKEAAFDAFAHGQIPLSGLVFAGLVVGSALTVAYSARFLWGTFFSSSAPPAPGHAAEDPIRVPPTVAPGFVIAPLVLAAITVVLGLAPRVFDPLVDAATRSLVPGSRPGALTLWHGFTLPLAATIVALGIGGLLAWRSAAVGRVLALGARVPSGDSAYLASLRGLNVVADRTTGFVQSGSLPVYSAVILFTAAALPGFVLLTEATIPDDIPLLPATALLPMIGAIVGAAAAAATVRRRFVAALFLGLTGYGMAGLFVVYGAPDLALTQVTVETLSTVVFMLVLRHLPDRFERQSGTLRRGVRAAVALSVAAMVFVFALVVSDLRTSTPVSDEIIERAQPDGHGRNVVNVIIVDFRGFDTLGEITVLAVAAIGAVALARAVRRSAAGGVLPAGGVPPAGGAGGSPQDAQGRRRASDPTLQDSKALGPGTSGITP